MGRELPAGEGGGGAVHEQWLLQAAVEHLREVLSEQEAGAVFSLGPTFSHGRDAVFRSLRVHGGFNPEKATRQASGFTFITARPSLQRPAEASVEGHAQLPSNVRPVHFFYLVAPSPSRAKVAPYVRKSGSSHIAVAQVVPLSADHQGRKVLVHTEDPRGQGYLQFQMLDSGCSAC